jgi:ABC-type multidrug transport system ATPase subunit
MKLRARTVQSLHVVIEGQGHGQLGVGCVPRLLADFLDAAHAGTRHFLHAHDLAGAVLHLVRRTAAVIAIEELHKSFGSVRALKGVSFTAQDGRITGLLGPNGAGKTTTLRTLATLLRPDAGGGRVDGHDILREPLEVRRKLGVLPHSAGIYPNLTGRENISYFGALHGLERAVTERRVDELVTLLEMREFADRRAKGYSQGERLKVAIARALARAAQRRAR